MMESAAGEPDEVRDAGCMVPHRRVRLNRSSHDKTSRNMDADIHIAELIIGNGLAQVWIGMPARPVIDGGLRIPLRDLVDTLVITVAGEIVRQLDMIDRAKQNRITRRQGMRKDNPDHID